ncbi:MAG: glycoside hydrolase family 15 protein, partial [Thermoplasmata archaeon]|nr:glycoside hydrolase family 15 protein [Thermoplasmata archaeon]
DRVRRAILTHGCPSATGGFVQSFGSTRADAANLRIPLVGFLPFRDPRVVRTVERIEKELSRGPFVYRYRNDDGLPG